MTKQYWSREHITIRTGTRAIFERILVPINGSPAACAAEQVAVGLAHAFAGSIRFVFVLDERIESELTAWTGEHARDVVDKVRDSAMRSLGAATSLAAELDVPSESALVEGDVVDQLLLDATAWKADVIIIGTHSRGHGLAPSLGSKTAELLRRTTLPVLVIR
jgi:nucleotide-binding universal stress UspA family protein